MKSRQILTTVRELHTSSSGMYAYVFKSAKSTDEGDDLIFLIVRELLFNNIGISLLFPKHKNMFSFWSYSNNFLQNNTPFTITTTVPLFQFCLQKYNHQCVNNSPLSPF